MLDDDKDIYVLYIFARIVDYLQLTLLSICWYLCVHLP